MTLVVSCVFYIFICIIAMVVCAVYCLVINRLRLTIICFLIAGVLWLWFDIVTQRVEIISRHYIDATTEISDLTYNFLRKHNRYPLTMEDLITTDQHANYEMLKIGKRLKFRNMHLINFRWPELTLKTYIEDSLIYCVSYSYGFDNDNDSLVKHYIKYDFYENPSIHTFIYIMCPISMNGDIFLDWTYEPISSPLFDTSFVRRLMEIQ